MAFFGAGFALAIFFVACADSDDDAPLPLFKSYKVSFDKGVLPHGCLPTAKITGFMDDVIILKEGELLPHVAFSISDSVFAFAGWTDELEGEEVKFPDCAPAEFSSDTILHAVWQKGHNITFERGESDSDVFEVEGTMGSFFVEPGATFALPKLTYSFVAHDFLGWSTTANGAPQYNYTTKPLTSISQSTTLYAKWKRKGLAVKFNSGQMSLDDEDPGMAAQVFEYKTSTATQTSGNLNPVTFTRRGAVFLGWTDSAAGNTVIYPQNSKIKLTEDKELFALWRLGVVWVTFSPGSSQYSSVTGSMPRQEADNGRPTKIIDNRYICPGYDFYEWTYEEEGEQKAAVNADLVTFKRDTHLTATWRAHECKAAFYPNGGTDSKGGELLKLLNTPGKFYHYMDPATPFTFPDCKLDAPKDLYFVGWGTSPTAKKKDLFKEGQTILWQWYDDVKFYAVWEVF